MGDVFEGMRVRVRVRARVKVTRVGMESGHFSFCSYVLVLMVRYSRSFAQV